MHDQPQLRSSDDAALKRPFSGSTVHGEPAFLRYAPSLVRPLVRPLAPRGLQEAPDKGSLAPRKHCSCHQQHHSGKCSAAARHSPSCQVWKPALAEAAIREAWTALPAPLSAHCLPSQRAAGNKD